MPGDTAFEGRKFVGKPGKNDRPTAARLALQPTERLEELGLPRGPVGLTSRALRTSHSAKCEDNSDALFRATTPLVLVSEVRGPDAAMATGAHGLPKELCYAYVERGRKFDQRAKSKILLPPFNRTCE
jgi:hypothetical protein